MKLRDYLKTKRISIREFAQLGEWSYMTVYFWMYGKDQYRRLPGHKNMLKISELTNNRVRPNDFY